MSIKLRKDGPTYMTEVINKQLKLHINDHVYTYDVPFIAEDYPLENTYFNVSDIMGYFENSDSITILRFDGTVTRYNKEYEITGFNKFDPKFILDNIVTIPVGCVVDVDNRGRRSLYRCCIRVFERGINVLESTNDQQPHQFSGAENKLFTEDLKHGSPIFPILTKSPITNTYWDENNKYELISYPIPLTGEVLI